MGARTSRGDNERRERVGLAQRHELRPSSAPLIRRCMNQRKRALQRRSRLHHQFRHAWDAQFDGARDGAGVVASVRSHLRHLECCASSHPTARRATVTAGARAAATTSSGARACR